MLTYDMEGRGSLARYEYLYRCIKSDILAVSYTHLNCPSTAFTAPETRAALWAIPSKSRDKAAFADICA